MCVIYKQRETIFIWNKNMTGKVSNLSANGNYFYLFSNKNMTGKVCNLQGNGSHFYLQYKCHWESV